MRFLSVLCWIVFGVLFVINIVSAFYAWLGLWGVGGAIFTVGLFPIAITIWPVGEALNTGDWSILIPGVFLVGGMIGCGFLASWFRRKHEQLEELRYPGA